MAASGSVVTSGLLGKGNENEVRVLWIYRVAKVAYILGFMTSSLGPNYKPICSTSFSLSYIYDGQTENSFFY